MLEKKKVIIIGSGVAGISAAIELIQEGYEVEIFESKNIPGGRVYSIFDDFSGEEHDNGQHLLSGAYHHFIKILKLLGTDNLIKKQKNLRVTFSYPDGERDILDGSPFSGRFGLLFGLMKLKKICLKSKYRILIFFIKLLLNKLIRKNLTVRELLLENGQTDEAILSFWEPLTLATLNASIDSAPAVLLIEVLKRAFFAEKEAACLIFPAVGLNALLEHFPIWFLEKGGKIHFGESVKKIIINDNKAVAIETKSGEQFFADYFISTVQPNSLLRILSNSENDNTEFEKLKNFEYSTIISIYLWLDKELKGIDFSAMIGTKTHWLFNRRAILKGISSGIIKFNGHIALTISAADDLSDLDRDKLTDMCFAEVKRCFPELKEAKILHKIVLKDKFATVKLTTENNHIRPKTETDISNFFLAGDWTDTNLPATIEGAAVSGKNASEVIKRLK